MKPIELWHGDCLDMLSRVPEASVRMAYCDLPFAVTSNKWDTPIDLERFWPLLWRVMVPSGVVIAMGIQPFTTTLIQSQRKHFRFTCVWDKVRASRFMLAKKMPLAQHEDVMFFYRKPPRYTPQMVKRDKPLLIVSSGKGSKNYGANHKCLAGRRILTEKYPTTILTHRKDKWAVHPTQKPVSLIEWLLKSYTEPGELVLDPTLGSASTALACFNLGRRCVGIEKSKENYIVGVNRVKTAMMQPRQTEMAL